MDDAHVVAVRHHADDGADERCGILLRVVSPLDDGVKQLPTGADLHDEADVALVLVHVLQAHHVGVAGQVVHDLDLTPHVVDLLGGGQLALGDDLQRGARRGSYSGTTIARQAFKIATNKLIII